MGEPLAANANTLALTPLSLFPHQLHLPFLCVPVFLPVAVRASSADTGSLVFFLFCVRFRCPAFLASFRWASRSTFICSNTLSLLSPHKASTIARKPCCSILYPLSILNLELSYPGYPHHSARFRRCSLFGSKIGL